MSHNPTESESRQQTTGGIDAELRDQLSDTLGNINTAIRVFAHARDSDRFWGAIKRGALVLAILGFLGFYALMYGRALGVQSDPGSRSIALIPIHGPIGPGLDASADQVVPIIERACRSKKVEALVLDINSGGGGPAEAERIMASIDRCRKGSDDKPGKKVYALISGTGASAAYMVAMRADRIYAGRYSLVGSIGTIIRLNDASSLAEKIGVREVAYRTAPLKGGPSILSGPTEEDAQAYSGLVHDLGQTFLEDVLATRGERITMPIEELYSGRLWTATQAKAGGLIDEIAVLEDLAASEFDGMRIHRYRTKRSFVDGIGLKALASQILADAQAPRVQ